MRSQDDEMARIKRSHWNTCGLNADSFRTPESLRRRVVLNRLNGSGKSLRSVPPPPPLLCHLHSFFPAGRKIKKNKWVRLRSESREAEPCPRRGCSRPFSAGWGDPRDVQCPLSPQGKSVSLTNFFRIARNTMTMCFNKEPGAAEVEVSPRGTIGVWRRDARSA